METHRHCSTLASLPLEPNTVLGPMYLCKRGVSGGRAGATETDRQTDSGRLHSRGWAGEAAFVHQADTRSLTDLGNVSTRQSDMTATGPGVTQNKLPDVIHAGAQPRTRGNTQTQPVAPLKWWDCDFFPFPKLGTTYVILR